MTLQPSMTVPLIALYLFEGRNTRNDLGAESSSDPPKLQNKSESSKVKLFEYSKAGKYRCCAWPTFFIVLLRGFFYRTNERDSFLR